MILRRTLFALPVLVALDLAGFGMVVTDIQFRLLGMNLPGWAIGAILSSMFLVQIPASTLWGRVADRVGARRVMVLCTLLSAGSMLLYGFSSSPWMILASRVLAGLGGANVAMAYAIASVVATSDIRPRVVGRLGASTVLGLTGGAAVGGLVVERFGQGTLGLVAFCASLTAAAVGFGLAPDAPPKREEGGSKAGFFHYRGALLALMAVAAVAWLSLATLEGTFGRLIKVRLGFGQREFGLVFGFESLIGFFVQAFLFERLARLFSGPWVLSGSFILTGCGLAAMPFAPSLAALLVTSAFYAVGSGLTSPAVNDLVAQHATEEQRGEVYGAIQSLRSVGFVVGPAVGGVLFDLRPAAPYLVAAGICLAVSGLSGRLLSKSVPAPTA